VIGVLETLEKKYDTQFKWGFDALQALMAPQIKPKRKITPVSPDRRSPIFPDASPASISRKSRPDTAGKNNQPSLFDEALGRHSYRNQSFFIVCYLRSRI
jgi:hypothetical protein